MRGHTGTVKSLVWSPGGDRLASISGDMIIKIWDVNTWEAIASASAPSKAYPDWFPSYTAWSPDGRYLAQTAGFTANVFDATAGDIVYNVGFKGSQVYLYENLAWSPDSRSLAGAAYDVVSVWDMTTGQEICALQGHSGRISRLAWSPDGQRLASASLDETIKVWNTRTWQEVVTLREHAGPHRSVAWSPDGRRLASASDDGTIKIWDASAGYEVEGTHRVEAAFNRVRRLVAAGKHEEAVEILKKAVDEFPDVPEYRTELAQCYADRARRLVAAGKHEEAIEVLEKLVAQHPENREFCVELASMYSRRAGTYNQKGEFRKAIADYEKASELDADNAARHDKLAFMLARCQDVAHRDYDRALKHAKIAVTLAPDNAHNRWTCAIAHEHLGNYDGSLAELEKAIELDPCFAGAYELRSTVYSLMGNHPRALEEAQEAARLDPSSPWVQKRVAEEYLHLKEYKKALAAANKALELGPGPTARASSYFYSTRGDVHRKLELYRAAVADYDKSLELAPFRSYIYKRRALAHFHLKEYEKAIADADKAIELNPQDLSAYYWFFPLLAECPEADFRTAIIERVRETAERCLDGASAYNDLAWMLATGAVAEIRNPEKAVALATKAVELAPQQGMYWNTLGVAQYRAGDWKAAIEALDKSMELRSGGDSRDWFFLAMAHWKLDDKKKARQWYDKAVKWMDGNMPEDEELRRFRAEAEALMEITEPSVPKER